MVVDLASGADSSISAAEQALRSRDLDVALALSYCAEDNGADTAVCASVRWLVHMLRGAFEGAWLENDALRQRDFIDPHRMWDGEALAGKRVMLRCLHGYGDAIQFLRYVPLLKRSAAHVTIQVAPRFTEVARLFDGVTEVITWGETSASEEPPWDTQIEVMELPYILRTQLADLPVATHYLKKLTSTPRIRCGSIQPLQVGLVWTAGEWNPMRSVDLSVLIPVLAVPGCTFWNLQASNRHGDHHLLVNDSSCVNSIAGLAGKIATLDLLISADTMALHLAGALGVTAWAMLQFESDWRWMHGRDDSPWYPSLRLFRQAEARDWRPVIHNIVNELRRFVANRSEWSRRSKCT